MRFASAVLIFFVCSHAIGQDRISVVNNSDEMDIGDAVKSAATAFSSEDVASYGMCFKQSRRTQVRRQAAMLFAENKCSMEIVEVHVIESSASAASAAVRYNISDGGRGEEVLSEVLLVKEDGRWVIDKEKVKSKSDSRASVRGMVDNRPIFKPEFDLNPRGANKWNAFKPDPTRISPNLHHLMGDIGVREGMGCANGRCVNGRCEQR